MLNVGFVDDLLPEEMRDISRALTYKYEEAQADIQALSLYYGSQEWKHDFVQDEAGLLPKDLKRGILSEDAIWNLLEENRELGAQMAANTVGLGPQGDG